MSLETYSLFYYGQEVLDSNKNLNFDEGAGELTAIVDIGSYSHTELATAVQTALNDVGENTYTVTFNRSARSYTISSDDTFDLLITSGSQVGTSIFSTLGFTGADVTGLDEYSGGASGSEYEPQFLLQDFVSDDDNQSKIDAKVNESSGGTVEIVSFGTRKIIEMNIKYATDRDVSKSGVIKHNASGVSSLRSFMQGITKKGPFEFIQDISNKSSFKKVILESTLESKDGVAYKLKELSITGGPTGFFETGLLRLRVL